MSWLMRSVVPGAEVPPWSIAFRSGGEAMEFSARLPSRDEGLLFNADFALVLDIAARGRRRERAAQKARAAVLEAAREEARGHSVADHGLAEAELARRLLADGVVDDPDIRIGSVEVRVGADEADVELVKSRERCIPRYALKEEELLARLRHLERLTEEVYSDPATALRWWYDHNPERTGELDVAADRLRLVTAEGRGADGEPSEEEAAGRLVADLLRGLTADDRTDVLDRLAGLFDA
ncbi:hypothetical protein, partial [Nocardiopsis potens]|uniref:hypothetical protein n=1 Tax=Nocardiopsis potens TaxID=1246458 RepID=UPI0004773D22